MATVPDEAELAKVEGRVLRLWVDREVLQNEEDGGMGRVFAVGTKVMEKRRPVRYLTCQRH